MHRYLPILLWPRPARSTEDGLTTNRRTDEDEFCSFSLNLSGRQAPFRASDNGDYLHDIPLLNTSPINIHDKISVLTLGTYLLGNGNHDDPRHR